MKRASPKDIRSPDEDTKRLKIGPHQSLTKDMSSMETQSQPLQQSFGMAIGEIEYLQRLYAQNRYNYIHFLNTLKAYLSDPQLKDYHKALLAIYGACSTAKTSCVSIDLNSLGLASCIERHGDLTIRHYDYEKVYYLLKGKGVSISEQQYHWCSQGQWCNSHNCPVYGLLITWGDHFTAVGP